MRNNSSGCERAYRLKYLDKPGFWLENFYELVERYPTMRKRYEALAKEDQKLLYRKQK